MTVHDAEQKVIRAALAQTSGDERLRQFAQMSNEELATVQAAIAKDGPFAIRDRPLTSIMGDLDSLGDKLRQFEPFPGEESVT